jgi:hypothetical protein
MLFALALCNVDCDLLLALPSILPCIRLGGVEGGGDGDRFDGDRSGGDGTLKQ